MLGSVSALAVRLCSVRGLGWQLYASFWSCPAAYVEACRNRSCLTNGKKISSHLQISFLWYGDRCKSRGYTHVLDPKTTTRKVKISFSLEKNRRYRYRTLKPSYNGQTRTVPNLVAIFTYFSWSLLTEWHSVRCLNAFGVRPAILLQDEPTKQRKINWSSQNGVNHFFNWSHNFVDF